MSPVKRAARLVIWFAAAGLIVIGGLNLILEFIEHRLHQTPVNVWRCIGWSVPVLIGAVLFVRGSALASRLCRDFDDE